MIPSEELIQGAVANIEAEIHKGGWDQPARLFTLHGLDDSLVAAPVPLPDGQPGDFLESAARAFTTSSRGRALVRALATPRFAGFLFISESWANYTLTPEQYENEARRLADIPGSVESRDVQCVDTAGRVLAIHRQRGKRPLTTWADVPKQRWEITGGRIVEALLAMTTEVASKCPLGSADLDALRKVTPMTPERAQQIIDDHGGTPTNKDINEILYGGDKH